ncbi:uncharacterized protein METZ01_LOCUS430858 [marine metagenome]|uniref:Uncharacterized protein n=1 Tax=marine metagenome TaxID=408172 RepID=A0A382Y472_9ZZZZ
MKVKTPRNLKYRMEFPMEHLVGDEWKNWT